jgi:hypothetical protein
MASAPDLIVLERDRDLRGRDHEIWIRRALFALVCAVPVLALLNVFGQRPVDTAAAAPEAALTLHAPETVRSGLLYEARFRVTAREDIHRATLVLAPGWLESMTTNTIEPSPESETSADGRLSLQLGDLPAGKTYVLFIQFQVNPTNVGRRSQDVALYDGPRKLLEIHRTITVFP